MYRGAVFFLVGVISCSAEALDVERFLSALRQVETGNWVRDGAQGERGPWQVTAVIWSMHMRGTSFEEARKEALARACATRHVEMLSRQLRAAGGDDNAFNVALAWNAGLPRTLAGRAPLSSYDHALRVSNLYESASAPAVAKKLEPPAGPRPIVFAIR